MFRVSTWGQTGVQGQYLGTETVHVGQVFGQGGQRYVLLEMPQGGGVDLHPLHPIRLDATNLTEDTLRLQHTHTRHFQVILLL